MKPTKNTSINVRVAETDKAALEEIALILDQPAAQIARGAVKEKIAALQQELHDKIADRRLSTLTSAQTTS